MPLDLSSLGILVKDEQGNLQEKKLGEVLGVSAKGSPSTSSGNTNSSTNLQNFRQQLSKVTGETGYQVFLKAQTTSSLRGTEVTKQSPEIATPRSTAGLAMTQSVPPHHLTGPVQEIGSLSLDDLRHWNSKEQIIKHLTDEVALLAKDSLTVRANGIRAWQKSPLHQLYLEIGRQSMVEDKPLGQVVEERTRAGKPTLTLEQFEALMEANEAMRY